MKSDDCKDNFCCGCRCRCRSGENDLLKSWNCRLESSVVDAFPRGMHQHRACIHRVYSGHNYDRTKQNYITIVFVDRMVFVPARLPVTYFPWWSTGTGYVTV